MKLTLEFEKQKDHETAGRLIRGQWVCRIGTTRVADFSAPDAIGYGATESQAAQSAVAQYVYTHTVMDVSP